MNKETLKEAVALSGKMGCLLIATTGKKGQAHIACAKKMELLSDDKICATEWFCPETIRNLHENPEFHHALHDDVEEQ